MDKKISRRDFLARLGLGAAAAALAACKGPDSGSSAGAVPTGGEMTYRINPDNGDRVSILGYGCMRWPMVDDPAHPGEQIIDQEAVNELVDTAIAHGINYFDTAPPYLQGKSEAATGIALARHPRQSYYLATKMSNFAIPESSATPEESLQRSIDMYHKSMENLQTDYFDYYLLHCLGIGNGWDDVRKRFIDNGLLDYLKGEREAGRIRNLGFSFHGDGRVYDDLLAMHDRGEVHWDFVQIQYNYLDYCEASELSPYNAHYLYDQLARRGIPAVIMEPLLGGRLATLNEHLNERLLTRSPQESIASWAFRFAGTPEGVLTVLSGMTYMEHLQDNLKTYCPLRPLDHNELAMLEECAREIHSYPTVPCTGCAYCMPCPIGLDIPGIFRHYNKCLDAGKLPLNSEADDFEKARREFLIGYDRSVPRLRQANHCIACRECEPHCPQTIRIHEQMARIDRYVEDLKQGTLG